MKESICREFAVELLEALSRYDLDAILAMFGDVSGPALPIQFPEPIGFKYRAGVDADSLIGHFIEGKEEVEFDFEMPFEEEQFRPMMIRTIFRGTESEYTVTLDGVVPT